MEGKEFVLRNRDLISEWLEVQLDFVVQENCLWFVFCDGSDRIDYTVY